MVRGKTIVRIRKFGYKFILNNKKYVSYIKISFLVFGKKELFTRGNHKHYKLQIFSESIVDSIVKWT